MGVYGNDEIPPTITHIDVIDYLDSLLIDINEQTDNIISLVCEKDDCVKFDRLLKSLLMKIARILPFKNENGELVY